MSYISDLQKQINTVNHRQGFWDKHNIPEKLCLIHSEVSEALEVDRKPEKKEPTPEMLEKALRDLQTKEDPKTFERDVKDTFGDELADIMIRTMDLAYEYGYDMDLHIEAKVVYNAQRAKGHGKNY